jgi:putative transposase
VGTGVKRIEDRERAEALIAAMRQMRAELGHVPAWYLAQASKELHRSPACLYRWMKDGVPDRSRASFQLADAQKVAVFEEHGVGAAWRTLRAEGQELPSRATWYRAATRDLSELERRYAEGGLPYARRAQLRLERREGGRGDCLIADHKLVDLLVTLPGTAKPARPWVTSFMEPSTRAIAGLAVSVRPHRGVVLAALGEAIRARPELSPAHGKPWMIRFDNGLEFLAKTIRSAAMDLGFNPVPLRRRSPWLNGKIERWHQTMTGELISRLPYWTDGPKRENGSLDLPAGAAPLPIEVFIELLLEWVAQYNFERGHSALEGRTPAQAWEQDATPLRLAGEQELRRYLLECPGTRVVEARGVKFQNRWYTNAALQDHLTRRVELRRMPHDARWLEIYSEGEWICRADRHDEASELQRQRVLQARAQAARQAAGIARRAKNRARVRWSTMTAAHPPQSTNSISAEEARAVEDPGAKVLDALGLSHRRGQRRR